MVPRVWVINPLWASVYFSPVDPVWAFMASPFRNNPGALLAVTAGIGWFSFRNDFTAIMPAVSQNNQGGFALAGWGSSLHDGAQMLVTGQEGRIALSAFRLSSDLLGLLPPGTISNPYPPQLTNVN